VIFKRLYLSKTFNIHFLNILNSHILYIIFGKLAKTIWRYRKGNQNPYIEEEQTTQKQKEQKDKQQSTKHYTHKTKDIE